MFSFLVLTTEETDTVNLFPDVTNQEFSRKKCIIALQVVKIYQTLYS